MAVDINDINANNWSISIFDEFAIVTEKDDISQCILIILETQKGSDPFRPEFGCDILRYLDKPINIARAGMIREILQAIEIWEPRCSVENVQVTIDASSINFRITWSLAADQQTQQLVTGQIQR